MSRRTVRRSSTSAATARSNRRSGRFHLGRHGQIEPAQWPLITQSLHSWAQEHKAQPNELGARMTYLAGATGTGEREPRSRLRLRAPDQLINQGAKFEACQTVIAGRNPSGATSILLANLETATAGPRLRNRPVLAAVASAPLPARRAAGVCSVARLSRRC